MYVCVQATNGIYVLSNLNFFSEDRYLIHHGGRSRNREKNIVWRKEQRFVRYLSREPVVG